MMRYRLDVALLARRFPMMGRLRRRTVIPWSMVVLVLSAAGYLLLGASSILYRTVEVTDIQPEIGLAYTGRLADQELRGHGHPSPAKLYMIERSGSGTRTLLGPGNSQHEDIRREGGGRYSVWYGHVYFSLPPGKQLADVDRFEVVAPPIASHFANLVALLGVVAALSTVCLVVALIGPMVERQRGRAVGAWGAAEVRWKALEARSVRVWLWSGLPVLLLFFYWVLNRGGWSGSFDRSVCNYCSIAGLVPYSDAAGYFRDTIALGLTGEWGEISSRRPSAASVRQLIALVADYSYVGSLLVQAAVLGALLWYAAYRLMIWRGLLAGLLFAVLIVSISTPFIGTFLTEPIGMMFALLSIIFLIETMRRQSFGFGLLALGALTFAMLTRLGALLLVPMMGLWLLLFFGRGHVDHRPSRAGGGGGGSTAHGQHRRCEPLRTARQRDG